MKFKFSPISIMFILSLTLMYSPANADTTFRGVSEADAGQIKKRYPELFSDKPPLYMFDEAVKLLAKSESYSRIEVNELPGGNYEIYGMQLRRVVDFEIAGNDAFDRDEIIGALGLKIGTRIDTNKLSDATDRLKEFYGRAGFLNVLVSFTIKDINKNDLKLLVRVREREPCLITQITFNIPDKNDDLRAKIERRVKKHLNNNFTENEVTEIETAITEYLNSNRYLNTKLQQKEARYNNKKTQVTLVYEITDPYSYEIIINGNRDYTSGKIISKIQVDELSKGSTDIADDIAKKIRDFYISQGYAHVKLSYTDRVIQKTFTKQIIVDLNEGPRVRLESLDVAGRISKPGREYSQFIIKNSSDTIADRHYVKSDLDLGYKNLITDLNNQGYLKAKVQSSRVEYNDKKDKAYVTILIDEGPLTQLTKINFVGVKSFDTQQLQDVLTIKSNAPLQLNQLEESIMQLKQFYYDRGFIEMKIINEGENLVEYKAKALEAEIHFNIEEGPQVYIKRIYIEGNTFTKDYVIYREAGFDVGDLVTPYTIDEARKRLEKLAIFSRVDIRTLEANTMVSQRTLVINVSERNPGLFKFGAGLTNKRELTARGYSGLSYNNIAGTARAVSLRGSVEQSLVQENYLEYEVGVGYLEPFLFNRRLRGRTGYTRSERVFENQADDPKVLATDSINFSIEKDLTSKIKFTWLFWGFDSVEQYDLPSSGPLKRESQQEIAYLGPSIEFEFRDNPFAPTEGAFASVNAEYSDPAIGSSDKIQFVRTQSKVAHYLRLGTPKLVWANEFRSGYEKNLSTEVDSGIPQSFAFFLGGFTSIRGYSGTEGDRIPNSNEFPILDTNQLIIPNESTFYSLKSEFRFPLWVDPFGGVVFYDAGQVDVSGFEFKNPLRQSYGIGVRINTPVGPISLDYARKTRLNYEGESPDHWHLSIGTF